MVSPVSLEAGIAAAQQAQYQNATSILEAFCHDCAVNSRCTSREYLQAQMHLVKIYAQNGAKERAFMLCEYLTQCENAQVQIWAQQTLRELSRALTLDTSAALSKRITVPKAIETLVLLLRRKPL